MENRTNGLSIAGFVVSCVSMIIDLFGVMGVVGLILSAIGRSRAVNEGGKTGLATAGIVLGVIGVIWGVIQVATMSA